MHWTFLRTSAHTLCFPLLLLSCAQETPQDTTPPNILLIVADDLGYTDLGCFGSEISTPNLDALARTGVRNTAFYTASTCSPTRAMLLSGVDNHRNGYGTMEGNWSGNQRNLRGYEGHLNFDVVTFASLLHDHGYHTSISGKWHQAFPANDTTLWPGKRGFERSFALIQGGAGHFGNMQKMFNFYPRSFYTTDDVLLEALPDDFYSTDAYTDYAIDFISESLDQERPFLAYVPYTAPHWPLQVPDDIIDKYQGRYDAGYEVLAQERFARGKDLGTIPANAVLPPLTPNVMPWNELTSEEQARSSRIMEVYAAMIDRLDTNVGKLVDHLKQTGVYDNTLIMFFADNGAEGNWIGAIADTEEWVAANFNNSLENIGRVNSYVYTGPGWAQVSTLPFKWYKGYSSEGGVRCPSIISHPGWTALHGTLNHQYLSVMDVAPTLLDLAGVAHPGSEYDGRSVFAMDGKSMLPWLTGQTEFVHDTGSVHCGELFGRRSVRRGPWKAEWLERPHGFDDWALYNLASDPGELQNLADTHPEVLADLLEAWDEYVEDYQVTLPLESTAYTADRIWRE